MSTDQEAKHDKLEALETAIWNLLEDPSISLTATLNSIFLPFLWLRKSSPSPPDKVADIAVARHLLSESLDSFKRYKSFERYKK